MVGFASIQQYWVGGLFAAFAGACIATVTVAGNSYVVQTVADEIRGRVFTALESVIKIALLLSMIVIAPLGDLVGMIAKRVLEDSGLAPRSVMLTGPRLTLLLSALIVVVAAVYAFTVLRWKQLEPAAEEPEKVGESDV
jgi:MFS family permease